MNKNDGGPAFPDWSTNSGGYASHSGISLREYYAAEAMKPLIQNFLAKDLHLDNPDWMEGLAGDAFRMADAMLKEENDEQ